MNLLQYKGDVIVPNELIFAVCALVVREDGKVLGVTRKTDHNAWGLVGGKIDPGETAIEAIIREVKEETGLNLINPQFHFVQDCIDINGMKPCAVFRANVIGVIHHNEPHLVDWINPNLVLMGPFSEFNKNTFSLLNFKY